MKPRCGGRSGLRPTEKELIRCERKIARFVLKTAMREHAERGVLAVSQCTLLNAGGGAAHS